MVHDLIIYLRTIRHVKIANNCMDSSVSSITLYSIIMWFYAGPNIQTIMLAHPNKRAYIVNIFSRTLYCMIYYSKLLISGKFVSIPQIKVTCQQEKLIRLVKICLLLSLLTFICMRITWLKCRSIVIIILNNFCHCWWYIDV